MRDEGAFFVKYTLTKKGGDAIDAMNVRMPIRESELDRDQNGFVWDVSSEHCLVKDPGPLGTEGCRDPVKRALDWAKSGGHKGTIDTELCVMVYVKVADQLEEYFEANAWRKRPGPINFRIMAQECIDLTIPR